jgi:hypothetical protein
MAEPHGLGGERTGWFGAGMSRGFPAVRRLAFVYHPRSFATMEISAAAEGLCELVWIVDRDLGETAAMLRLLQRLGDVVDVTGLDHDAAAAAVAAARPDGILALHDALLSWTAEVAQRLGLPFHLPQTARELSDKRAQRAALAAAGVAMPASLPSSSRGSRTPAATRSWSPRGRSSSPRWTGSRATRRTIATRSSWRSTSPTARTPSSRATTSPTTSRSRPR